MTDIRTMVFFAGMLAVMEYGKTQEELERNRFEAIDSAFRAMANESVDLGIPYNFEKGELPSAEEVFEAVMNHLPSEH